MPFSNQIVPYRDQPYQRFASSISKSNPSYLAAVRAFLPEEKIPDESPDWSSFTRHKDDDPPVNLMEIFYSLDDNTLRRVFMMGSLKESQLRNIAEDSIASNGVTEVSIAED